MKIQEYTNSSYNNQEETLADIDSLKHFIQQPKKKFRETSYRWLALCFSCLMVLGNYMCYDFPGVLNSNIQKDMNVNAIDTNFLYTAYSIPNIIMPILSGYLLDYLGLRIGIFVLATIEVIGQLICAIGSHPNIMNFNILIGGRIVFGLAGESLIVAQSAATSKWFGFSEQSLAFGINLTVGRLGTILGSLTFPIFYAIDNKIYLALMFGFIICVCSWIFAILLSFLDKYADMKDRIQNKQNEKNSDDNVRLSDIYQLGKVFWLICFSCFIQYISFFSFMNNVQIYIQKQYGINEQLSSSYFGIPFYLMAITSPIFGYFNDKIGKRGVSLIVSSVLLIISHILMLILPQCGDERIECSSYYFLLPLIVIGISSSLFNSVLFASVPLVCELKVVATAYGTLVSIYNIGLAIGPIIASRVIENTKKQNGFYYQQILYIAISFFLLGIVVVIYIIDIKNQKQLDKVYSLEGKTEQEAEDILLKRRSVLSHRSFTN